MWFIVTKLDPIRGLDCIHSLTDGNNNVFFSSQVDVQQLDAIKPIGINDDNALNKINCLRPNVHPIIKPSKESLYTKGNASLWDMKW